MSSVSVRRSGRYKNVQKGRFKPLNPQKYKGDVRNIIYRSGLERKFFNYLDKHRSVLAWSSEEVIVGYRSPVDGKQHRYFVDVWLKVQQEDGTSKEILVEIKPADQCKPPKVQQRKTRRYLEEVSTWGINQAKWEAATEFASRRGMTFTLLTERDLDNLPD